RGAAPACGSPSSPPGEGAHGCVGSRISDASGPTSPCATPGSDPAPVCAPGSAGSTSAAKALGTPGARRRPTVAAHDARQHVSGPGSEVSPGDFLQDADVQGLLGHDLLEARVLFLQLPESLRLIRPPAAALGPPAVQRRRAAPQLPRA